MSYVLTIISLKFLYQLPIFCGTPVYTFYSDRCNNEDLIPLDRLNELKLKENGGYSCYRGHEYVDEEHETLKGSLLFYIKQETNNLMVGIQVPIKQNDQEENVKPYLFKLINGIRLDN